jgi:hypothetical protein
MFERYGIICTSKKSSEVDGDLSFPIDAGLIDTPSLSDMKVIGLFGNPLFQNSERMVESGMITEEQMENGEVELTDRLERFHERQVTEVMIESSDTDNEKLNKWDGKLRQDTGEDSPADKAAKELSMWKAWCKMKYLPIMEPMRVLGAIGEGGQPKEPVYSFGPVVKRGKNLPSKRNHADYVSKSGYYDFVKMLEAHKDIFPAIHSVLVGEAAPVLHTEVDCEGLFNTAGHINHPKRALTAIRHYERLVVAKHRMARIYCSPEAVHKLFMERFHDNSWDENEDRDDREFLAIEKDICLESSPSLREEFEGDEEDIEKEWNQEKEDNITGELKSAAESNAVGVKNVNGRNNKKGKETIELDSSSDDEESSEDEEESSEEEDEGSSSQEDESDTSEVGNSDEDGSE